MAADISMSAESTTDVPTVGTTNQIEQFMILAKSAKGLALLELIKQVLEAPGIHVFGELLSMSNIAELKNSPHSNYWNTLNLFAYGTYKEYLKNPAEFLDLTPLMKKKLQHLSIVSMAVHTKCIPYNQLLQELEVKNVRDLEDLIIEAIYADIIHGKLDQKNSQLEIDSALGRDIRLEDIAQISKVLQYWLESCESVLGCIEEQINRANSEKARRTKHKELIEQEILNVKKALKTQMTDTDEAMANDQRDTTPQDSRKKSCKSKSGRPSGKSWFKPFT